MRFSCFIDPDPVGPSSRGLYDDRRFGISRDSDALLVLAVKFILQVAMCTSVGYVGVNAAGIPLKTEAKVYG